MLKTSEMEILKTFQRKLCKEFSTNFNHANWFLHELQVLKTKRNMKERQSHRCEY